MHFCIQWDNGIEHFDKIKWLPIDQRLNNVFSQAFLNSSLKCVLHSCSCFLAKKKHTQIRKTFITQAKHIFEESKFLKAYDLLLLFLKKKMFFLFWACCHTDLFCLSCAQKCQFLEVLPIFVKNY